MHFRQGFFRICEMYLGFIRCMRSYILGKTAGDVLHYTHLPKYVCTCWIWMENYLSLGPVDSGMAYGMIELVWSSSSRLRNVRHFLGSTVPHQTLSNCKGFGRTSFVCPIFCDLPQDCTTKEGNNKIFWFILFSVSQQTCTENTWMEL